MRSAWQPLLFIIAFFPMWASANGLFEDDPLPTVDEAIQLVTDADWDNQQLLLDFNIEIGTSFGPLKGRIWRIGTMGYNARTDAGLHTLQSLETVLRRAGHKLPSGGGVDAALDSFSGSSL